MKAVVLRSPGLLEYLEVPAPKLARAEDVLIEVKACGICGSDLRYWKGENLGAAHARASCRQSSQHHPGA